MACSDSDARRRSQLLCADYHPLALTHNTHDPRLTSLGTGGELSLPFLETHLARAHPTFTFPRLLLVLLRRRLTQTQNSLPFNATTTLPSSLAVTSSLQQLIPVININITIPLPLIPSQPPRSTKVVNSIFQSNFNRPPISVHTTSTEIQDITGLNNYISSPNLRTVLLLFIQ